MCCFVLLTQFYSILHINYKEQSNVTSFVFPPPFLEKNWEFWNLAIINNKQTKKFLNILDFLYTMT